MDDKDTNAPAPDGAAKAPAGVAVIEACVKTLPGSPGVYRMMNAAGDVLYVGKAKNLKKRVTAYTQPQKQSIRIQRMIAATASMEFTTTHTEAEALLLEANLIKKLKPRYNILLRDDKSFPYILITGDHDFPQVTKHRGARDRKGEYFGPFASGFAVNETLAVLHKAFLLRNCSDHVFALRTRPCLQYQIKRCTAPCVAKVTHRQYAEQVDMARQFLEGRSRAIQEEFAGKMQTASDNLDFEEAAAYRDRIRALTQIQAEQTVNVEGLDSADVFAIHRDAGASCVQVFFFRAGQNFGNRAYFPRHEKDETTAEILSAFIAQFYTNKPVPRDIIVTDDVEATEVLEQALRDKAGYKVSIARPQRGERKQLTDMALKNAREALARRMADAQAQEVLFEKLAEVFGLDAPPERIEIYDNSHIAGTHTLGAMVVATPEGLQKNAYRKFNAKSDITGGDDYGMMREMLSRRFQSLLKAEGEGETPVWPDLLLIDGGQGQLSATMETLAELGIDGLTVVAIAKGPDRNAGREKFFMPGRDTFSLPPDDPVLYFLQRLRDEAHRFAITSHRARRSKAIGATPLDSVPGIGARRKKALLLHFGSAKAVAEAGVADLQKVTGISKAVAERIYAFFHDTDS
ncbi:MAG TPA: excinuclease ABC subunit UvrC [Alphaproteobacteria bacterium]|nr:excinuclease ABC subunit UvrC [Alphaproteobacteria bacterium]